MRVSEYFNLEKNQAELDFVDVPLETDVAVFIDPSALRNMKSPWGHECVSYLTNYFEVFLNLIKDGKDAEARNLVSCLNERNEFHLGYSQGRSRGHAFGKISAESVWSAISKSRASKSGLLKDLEDSALLIEGIGTDMISDAICNILRIPLIQYTQDMCSYYGIPTVENIPSGPCWNPENEKWESSFVPLPVTDQGPVILVPKIMTRHQLSYQYDKYYTHFLLPEMRNDEIKSGSSLVYTLKNGAKFVSKKALREKYGDNKRAVVEQTIKRTHILDIYRDITSKNPLPPIGNAEYSKVSNSEPPRWDELIKELAALPVGNDAADQYENLVERILTALFYPSLCKPQKQHRIHQGRKRIDITYLNEARHGFFYWLSTHFSSAMIFVECKNYGREIGNPEIDQLSGRFSPSRGQVGLLLLRSIEDEDLLNKRCRDTAQDHRGMIITLTDSDLCSLMRMESENLDEHHSFPTLQNKFNNLIL